MHRQRHHNTRLAFYLRRLRLSVQRGARVARTSRRTFENWKQGRTATPRVALRLLAAWRLLHWGDF